MADEFNMDAAVASYAADAAPTMQATMATAVTQNPDTQAQLARISADTGIPLGSAADNLIEAKRQQSLKAMDFPGYEANNPVAAGMLADPAFAGVAHDDTENLAVVEASLKPQKAGTLGTLGIIGRQLYAGASSVSMGAYGAVEVAAKWAADAGLSNVPGPFMAAPGLQKEANYLRRQVAQDIALQNERSGVQDMSFVGRAVSSGVQSIGANLPGILLSVATGNPGPALAVGGITQGGISAGEALDKGRSAPTAALYGASDAAIEVGTEMLPIAKLLGDLDAGSSLAKTLYHQAITEIPGELLATTTQKLNEWAVLNPDKPFSSYLKELPAELGQTLIATMTAVGAQTTAVRAVATTPQKVMDRVSRARDRAANAEQNAQALDNLTTTASASKLRERDPIAFANFVEKAAEAGGAETVYLDPRALAQSGIDPAELAKASPSVASQLDEAVKTGVDIKIPTSEFATHLAGTDMGAALIDHLRMDPDAMSRSEAHEYMQTQGKELEADIQKNVDNIALDNKIKQSQGEVEKNVLGQLTNANRFTSEVNKIYASLIGNFFTTQAARFGLTPEGLFNQYKLKIQAEGTKGDGKKGFFHGIAERLKAKPSIVDKDGNVALTHYSSTPGLASSDPAMWGTTGAALTRSERNRQAGGAPGRTYFGASDYIKEGQLGNIQYSASVPAAQLYDTAKDPLALRQKADENVKAGLDWDPTTAFEKLVIANGYKGAIIPTAKNGTAVAMYTPLPLTHVDEKGVMAPLGGAPKEQQAPSPIARHAAYNYMESKGLVYQPPTKYSPLDVSRAERLAAAFEAMEHNPEDPEVKAAYEAMIDETLEQYQQIKATGLVIEFIAEGQENPYAATPRMAIDDVNQNNHLWVYPTESGFGTDDRFNNSPLFAKVDEYIDGKQLQANDVFRIVHDYFGHIKDGTGFRAAGEENAWQSHAAMFSPLARRAMTTETRGQNSWLNYGPHGEHNRTADQATTKYADQKVGLLPEWASEEGFIGGPETGTPLDAPGYGQFAGERAQTADLGALARAERLEKTMGAEELRKLTGWSRGRDGKWRFEISDHDAATYASIDALYQEKRAAHAMMRQEVKEMFEEVLAARARSGLSPEAFLKTEEGKKLSQPYYDLANAFTAQGKELEALRVSRSYLVNPEPGVMYHLDQVLQHPKLYEAYPHLRDVRVKIQYDKNQVAPVQGHFLYNAGISEAQIELTAIGHDEMLDGLMHEVQHAIQKAEGFARGGSQEEIKQALRDANKEYTATMARLEESPAAEELADEFRDTFKTPLDATVFLPEAVGMVISDAVVERAQEFNSQITKEDMVQWVLDHPNYKALLQELRDAAASREGKVGDAIAKGPYQTYRALAGETEARNVERRRRMSEEARQLVAPSTSQDTPDSQQIVLFEDGTEARFVARTAAPDVQRGAFDPDTRIMTLLKAADLSTFLHESGHYFLEIMSDLAGQVNAPQEVKDDMQAALSWMGVPDLETWNSYGIEQKREAHEKFARGFEAYLFEGKAPSIELQGMFQRLRSWLLRVYKSIKGLNVELSPDIRGVFDRMLATADQIQEAESFRQMEALYGTMAESGMTSEEYMAYQKQGIQASQDAVTALEARSLRDMKWLSGARSRELKRLQKEAAGRRSEIKAEATKEVMSEPVNMATTFLKRGTINGETVEGGTKLSIPEIEAMYGDNPIVGAIKEKLGVGKYGMLGRENAIHPDQVAEMFGFTSGDQLVRSLLANEDPKEKINGLTDQRMLERYGDLTDEDAMNRAADKAVHNEARAKFIATELDALSKAQGKKKVSREAALAFAKVAVGRLKIMDLKPVRFAAAEARAALASMKAFKKGDLETAAVEKRNQLLNNYSAKEAYAAQDEVEKTLRYLKKFSNDGSRKKIDVAYLDQIDAILERFDLKPGTTLKSIRKRESLRAWIDSQVEQGLEPDISPDILDEANRKSFKEMTVEELRGLSDAIRQIDHLGRLKNKLLTEKDNREFKAVVSGIVANINEHADGRTADNRTRAGVGQALRLFKGFIASHRKVASLVKELDGFIDGGPMWNTFIRTMNEAGDKEAGMREKATKKLAKLVQPILSGEKMNGKGRFFESIGKSLNREERIGIALNTGNMGNFQRLLDGEGWTHAQIAPVLDTLTKEDWDFVQNVWDLFESYRPEIGAKEKRIYGKEPNWVEPTVVNTKFGQYRGGYYPVKYDPTRSQQAEQFNDAEAAKAQLKGAFTSSTTRRSFTKARADEVKGRPLLYSMDGLYRGLNEVIHDLSWHEWLIDANRLMRSRSLDGAIRNQYGAEFVKQLKDGIKDIAAGEMGNDGAFASALNQLRTGSMVAGIGFNIMNSIINVTGITQSFNRVGTKYMAMGLAEWTRNPRDLARRVQDMSEFMRLRALTMNREINEIQSLVRGRSKARDISNKLMFMPLTMTQMVVDTPTWWGAYQKAMTEQDDQAKAVSMADQAVIDAQGGGQMKDLAAIQRGGSLQKLFTTFYGYFSSTYNLAAEATNKTNFKDPMDVIRLAGDYLVLSVMPAFMGTILKTALMGGDDDWDAEELAKKLANDQISYLFGMMVGVREVAAAAQKIAGVNTYANGYGGPAGLRFYQELDKLAGQIAQGEVDEAAVKSAINVLGILFKLPSGQINRTIFGTKALIEGETDNPLAVISGPPPKN